MRGIQTAFLLILILVWGIAVWATVHSGLRNVKIQNIKPNEEKSKLLEGQKRISEESKAQRDRMIEDQKYQIQNYKDSLDRTKY